MSGPSPPVEATAFSLTSKEGAASQRVLHPQRATPQVSPFRFAASSAFHRFIRLESHTTEHPGNDNEENADEDFIEITEAYVPLRYPSYSAPLSASGSTALPRLVPYSMDVLCHGFEPKKARQRGGGGAGCGTSDARQCGTAARAEATQPLPTTALFSRYRENSGASPASPTAPSQGFVGCSTTLMDAAATLLDAPELKRSRSEQATPLHYEEGKESGRRAVTSNASPLLAAASVPSEGNRANESTRSGQCGVRHDGDQHVSFGDVGTKRQAPFLSSVPSPIPSSTFLAHDISLSSRVAENESLLEDLLGIATAHDVGAHDSSCVESARVGERHEAVPSIEEEVTLRDKRAETASASLLAVPPKPLPPSYASMTVKDLRAVCRAAGLHERGTKAELLERLRVFGEEEEEAKKKKVRVPSLEPPACSPPPTHPPAVCQARPSSQSAFIPAPVTSLYSASPEHSRSAPPRTIFRYRSPSHSNSGEPVHAPRVEDLQAQEQARRLHMQRRQRRVPSLQTFAEQFQAREAARGEGEPTRCAAVSPSAAPSWFLLVDHRERYQGSPDKLLGVFTRAGVRTYSGALPCGDYMFCVDSRSTASSGGLDGEAYLPKAHSVADQPVSAGATLFESSGADDGLFPLVVERKTLSDLNSSIKGSRYIEQRRLLQLSPFSQVIWLVEGDASLGPKGLYALRGGKARGGGGGTHAAAALAEMHARVNAACASLSLQPGFTVLRTRNLEESAEVLRCIGETLRHRYNARSCGNATAAAEVGRSAHAPARLLPRESTLQESARLQRYLRACTALPRMLMCIRGCSASLALFLTRKYGSLYGFWCTLQREGGPKAVDEDPEIRALSVAQRKVVVLLSEFVAAREYF